MTLGDRVTGTDLSRKGRCSSISALSSLRRMIFIWDDFSKLSMRFTRSNITDGSVGFKRVKNLRAALEVKMKSRQLSKIFNKFLEIDNLQHFSTNLSKTF